VSQWFAADDEREIHAGKRTTRMTVRLNRLDASITAGAADIGGGVAAVESADAVSRGGPFELILGEKAVP